MQQQFRLVVPVLVVLGAAQVATAQTPGPTVRFIVPPLGTAAAPGAQAGATPKVPASQAGGRWWNDPAIGGDLGLSSQVREKIDAAMDAVMKLQVERQRAQGEARGRYDKALRERKWDEADKAADELNQAMVAVWGAQNSFKIDVLKLLTTTQQEALLAKHEYLLGRPWLGGPGVTKIRFSGTPKPRPTQP